MDRQNKIVGIVGRKGSGKSTAFRAIARREKRLLIFDSMGEHSFVKDETSDLDVFENYLVEVEDPKERFQFRFVPAGEVEEEFDIVANSVYQVGNMTFGIEELPMLTRSPSYMQPSMGRIFRLGRHQAMNIIWTAQRAAEVPRGVTGATDFFILFQQSEPNDIKALSYRVGEEAANEVQNLGLHDFITFDVVTKEIGDMHDFMENDSLTLLSGGTQVESDGNQNFRNNKSHLSGVKYGS